MYARHGINNYALGPTSPRLYYRKHKHSWHDLSWTWL